MLSSRGDSKISHIQPDGIVRLLKVMVVEGRNLPAADLDGTSDPYCTLFLHDSRGTTGKGANIGQTEIRHCTLNVSTQIYICMCVYMVYICMWYMCIYMCMVYICVYNSWRNFVPPTVLTFTCSLPPFDPNSQHGTTVSINSKLTKTTTTW